MFRICRAALGGLGEQGSPFPIATVTFENGGDRRVAKRVGGQRAQEEFRRRLRWLSRWRWLIITAGPHNTSL
ncbi:hypothetical protein MJO28_009169 [Puccinia striiformis f. sp. tritici]|uniref:Uncharacterized protein n=1 Tax=Puccinia striiformis f. sp. tritici TaxID=168172 RepID=A0ACC0E8H7_9BASI|nr:hypothetical protein MJO28_009169 [Puccinia striiformis f. sp. tritici]